MIKKILAVCMVSNLIIISCEQKKSETHQKMADSTSAIQETTTANTKDSAVVKISKDEMDTFSKSVVGKYIATACDGGRFSIEIRIQVRK